MCPLTILMFCQIKRILTSSVSLLPLSRSRLLEMAANLALSLAVLGGLLVKVRNDTK